MAPMLLNAQNSDSIDVASLTVVYDYSVKTTDADGVPVRDAMQLAVQIGHNVAKSFAYSNYLQQTTGEWNADMAFAEAYLHLPAVWHNYPEGKVTTCEIIVPNEYEGVSDIPVIDWQISDDTLTIAEHLCHSATATFAGVTWNVWFTEDIATTAGPWKLGGLPGLIMVATDADSIHSFRFNGMTSKPSSIIYTQRPEVRKISNAKIVKHRNSIYCNSMYAKNPIYYVPDLLSSTTNVTVINTDKTPRVLLNGMFLMNEAHVFQPLEFCK